MTFINTRAEQRTASRDAVRVMLVDDSAVARSILSRILARTNEIELVVEAHDTKSALSALESHSVDIILLDIEMPVRTGLDALPEMIAKSNGAGIIIVSSFAEENGPAAIKALSLGACDTLAKPGRTGFSGNFSKTLVEKIINLGRSKTPISSQPSGNDHSPTAVADVIPDCIAIGASTGGIPAIFEIVQKLSKHIDCPIFITQHLPEAFMTFFARQLASHTYRTVVVAEENMVVQPNTIYVAPGSSHLVCYNRKGQIRIGAQLSYSNSRYCPSVDAMLESIAENYGDRAFAIILSGMGQDGLIGAREIWRKNGRIIAQNLDTSVVWGMPGAIVRENLAAAVLPPDDIAAMLNKLQAG
jgi:two-component system, chemotaxis family, protein-glutamate methylesterase/glutaminase